MRIKTTKSRRYTPWLIAASIALLVGGAVAAYFFFQPATTQEASSESTSTSQEASPSKNNVDEKTPAPSTEPSTSNSSSNSDSLSATITAINQNDSTLEVRVIINGIYGSGTCTLTGTKGSATITKTAGIQASASSSTCQGFSIPRTELSAGNWSFAIAISASGKTAKLTQSFTVE